MAFKKLVKRLDKLIAKQQLPEGSVRVVGNDRIITITSENRAAFRLLRDQFQGKVAADINHVYGLWGAVEVVLAPQQIVVFCNDERDKAYSRHDITEETLA